MKTIKIPKIASRQGIGFIGTIGSGKTQGMMQLFDSYINSKKVIVDVKGDYTSIYQKAEDKIFCPLDQRTIKWNIFNDIETYEDIANVALSLIPENPKVQDPYFDNAARAVLAGILIGLSKTYKPNNKLLWETISSPDAIFEIMKNDEEAKQKMHTYLGEDPNDKRVGSIISSISAMAGRAIEAISDIDGDFSFKKWANNINDKSSVFLIADPKYLDILLPTYKTIIEIISSEILSMPDNEHRVDGEQNEIFFWLDEFPRFRKLQKIVDLMTLGRSKGGKVVWAAQTDKQLEKEYGKEGAIEILDSTNTLFIYRTTVAKDFEEYLGKQEVLEYSENRSFGPHPYRDGGTYGKQKKTKPLVLSSNIQTLKDLEFYLRTMGSDTTKAKLLRIDRKPIHQKFIPNIKKIQKSSNFNKNLVKLTPADDEKIDFEEFL
ncbi:MAG: type IV secretion system DNA-binding domain-containing protein [Aliarcobacter cryaerophilus]|nr:type IV secretion system DNA-binding domain-containing protein [Aliarcobacter cryaerophilus]